MDSRTHPVPSVRRIPEIKLQGADRQEEILEEKDEKNIPEEKEEFKTPEDNDSEFDQDFEEDEFFNEKLLVKLKFLKLYLKLGNIHI